MDRIVLVMPTTTYRAEDFVAAAERAGLEVVVASDRCHVLDGVWAFPPTSLVIDFYAPDDAARIIAEGAPDARAIVPAGGEAAALVAALAADRLRLRANSVDAARAAASKLRMRQLVAAAGIPQPRFLIATIDDDPSEIAARVDAEIRWPCVVKPLLLSGSRGVIRADDAAGLARAHARVARILSAPALLEMDPVEARLVLVEEFIPGAEVALEGVLTDGRLRALAHLDKPDPLDGPFFEETIYVTPSRHGADEQAAVERVVGDAARAMGLSTGPVHAELRLPPGRGPIVIEIAARSIGGLCSRMLRFGTGLSLEDVLVRHAVGQPIAEPRERRAAGVMMLPIPAAGVLRSIDGVDDVRGVAGIEDVTITARVGDELVPLPEGASYLGFVFAGADTPDAVEAALRDAHARLRFTITPTLPVL